MQRERSGEAAASGPRTAGESGETGCEQPGSPEPRRHQDYHRARSLVLLQPGGGGFCKIGQDSIGPGALDGKQRFQDAGFFIQPAVLRSCLEHRVLAANLVDKSRELELLADTLHDIEVWKERISGAMALVVFLMGGGVVTAGVFLLIS